MYRKRLISAVIILLLALLPVSCTTIAPRSPVRLLGHTEYGKASYYAMKFQFQKTASGERFNQYSLTAAHRNLPFGTLVKVTNLNNNKSVVVKINDRGPFITGRIIDLSRSAFAAVGDIDSGIINVRIEVVD